MEIFTSSLRHKIFQMSSYTYYAYFMLISCGRSNKQEACTQSAITCFHQDVFLFDKLKISYK